jgi:uncharacterized protein YukE
MKNMNKVVITDSDKFEDIIQLFEHTIPKIKGHFDSERRNSQEINATATWTGASQRALYDKYKMLEANFNPIVETLELYTRFLKKTLEDYKMLEQQIKAKAEDFSDQLDVNS